MREEQLVLAGLFPPVDRAAWLALVEQGLRGAPFERLVSHTYDKLALQPLYTRADWQPEGNPVEFPGMMPFTRGSLPAGHVAGGWDVRQEHAHPDLEASHAAILTDLARGVTSLQLRCDAAGRLGLDPDDPVAAALAGVDGLMIYAVDDLETLLRQVRLDVVPIALEPGAQFVPLAALLMALWQRHGVMVVWMAIGLGVGVLLHRLVPAIDLGMATLIGVVRWAAAFCGSAGFRPGRRSTVTTTSNGLKPRSRRRPSVLLIFD